MTDPNLVLEVKSSKACCGDDCCAPTDTTASVATPQLISNATPDDIHEAVKSRYGRLAETSSSCCGSNASLYEADMNLIPTEVAEFSLGCGDPISIAEMRPGEVVVDLGSGGGLDAFLSAQRVGETGRVIGVDMTPAMIERATKARDKQGFKNVEFRLGQIEHMPIEDNTADVIISNCVINLAPDKKAVFKDAFRVLKSGGRFAVADIVTEGELTTDERANMDFWSECLTGAIDIHVYLGALREVGFVDTQVTHKVAYTGESNFSAKIFSARITARKP
ncbi:MAG: arsenite methyltransferase [Anaerolineae bacterium]|nr:arsenite methyltransferase [Anaerolineae bacterium]